jgi:hypothetical protein
MTESESLRRLVRNGCIPRFTRGGGDPVWPGTSHGRLETTWPAFPRRMFPLAATPLAVTPEAKGSSSARRHGKAANGVQDFHSQSPRQSKPGRQSSLLNRPGACMPRSSPQIEAGAMRIASTSFRDGLLKPVRRETVNRKNVAGLNTVNSPVALPQYVLVSPSIGRGPVGLVFHGMSQ